MVLQLLSAATALQLKRANLATLVQAAAAGVPIQTALPAKASKRGAGSRRGRGGGLKPAGGKALTAASGSRVLVMGMREVSREVRLGRARAVFLPLAQWPQPPVLQALRDIKALCAAAGVPFVQAGSKRAFCKALALRGRASVVALLSTQALDGLPYRTLQLWEAGPQEDTVGTSPAQAATLPATTEIALPLQDHSGEQLAAPSCETTPGTAEGALNRKAAETAAAPKQAMPGAAD
jgi:ribosomal protein L7Ae-like RNA K-turn-binding protein